MSRAALHYVKSKYQHKTEYKLHFNLCEYSLCYPGHLNLIIIILIQIFCIGDYTMDYIYLCDTLGGYPRTLYLSF